MFKSVFGILVGDDENDEFHDLRPADVSDDKDYIFGYDKIQSNNYVTARGGDDVLYGYGGTDVLYGGEGQDRIYGGDDKDYIFGGEGNDILSGDNGNDSINAGSGQDRVNGGDGNDFLYGGEDRDIIRGDDGNDTIYGGTGDDIHLSGANGDDTIFGGDGSDLIAGGSGDDVLIGNADADILYGGTGADVFGYVTQFDSTSSKVDKIMDFQVGLDTIDLSALGVQASNFVVSGSGVNYNVASAFGDFLIDIKTTGAELTVADIKFAA